MKAGAIFAGRYEILRHLSAGGMGAVYEVFHRETKRKRALKVMLPHVLAEPGMRERFALEAVVTADIESEHLVEIFDAGIDAETDSPFLVMELLRGEDLGSRLKRGERCSPLETVTFLGQAARALEKTHAAGIVHRDLKPENLFLTRRDDGSPRLKILDFGIAKLLSAGALNPKTTKSVGTPYYMAREQITGETALIGPASDLYALAQIAFTLLVGLPYFEDEAISSGGNILSVLMAVGEGTKEAASARAARRGVELPPAFDPWFTRATQIPPSLRFRSALELIEALDAAVSRAQPAVAASTPVASAFLPVAPPRVPLAAPETPPALPAPTPLPPPPAAALQVQTASPQSIPKAELTLSPRPTRLGPTIWVVAAAVAIGTTVGITIMRSSLLRPKPAANGDAIAATDNPGGQATAASGVTVQPSTLALPARTLESARAPSSAAPAASASSGKAAGSRPESSSVPTPAAHVEAPQVPASAPPVWTVR